MSSQWHNLRLSQKNTPPLLSQYSWTRKGYELYVTDLTSIWSERLPHEQIVKRAEENAATIDPCEGPEQLEVLLSKIGEALFGDGGHATLNKGASAGSLELTTSTRLPSPLKPLRWSLYLTKEPPSSLTRHLLLPLLKNEARWEADRWFLLDQIKQKDWVLGKLFDKFDALGVELGAVFPAATGLRVSRKGSTRAQAASLIKGIAPFDEQAESQKSAAGTSGLAANIVQETIGSARELDLAKLQPPRDQWWNDLERRPETSILEEEEHAVTDVPREAPAVEPAASPDLDLGKDGDVTAGSEEDEFQVREIETAQFSSIKMNRGHTHHPQRQETPPRLKNRAKRPAPSPPVSRAKKKSPSPKPRTKETDQATASESETEPAPHRERTPIPSTEAKQLSPPSQPKEPPKRPKGGLGVIGGKKKKEEKPPQRTPSPPPTKPANPTVETEPSHEPPTKTKRPTKLGMIGGKIKTKIPPRAETPPVQAEPATTSPKVARPATAVGAGSERTPKKESPTAERPAAPPITEQAAETEKDRADRRREELKRQLEAKSNAPTKKKRRF